MTRARSLLVVGLALLFVAAMLTTVEAQQSGRRGGMGARSGSLLGLLSAEKVQQELKLNEEQLGKVKEMREKVGAEMREQYSGLGEIEGWQKRMAKMAELRDQMDEKVRGQIREILEREQIVRLYRIRLQIRGPVYGLNNRFVAGRLNLTDEQKKKVADLQKATQEKTAALFGALDGVSREEMRKKFGEIREKRTKIQSEANEKALGLLNAEQKKAFEEMKGEKFEL